jgi:GTPase
VNPPRRRRELDESDVRIRPNPRGSRPRTKERPRHEDSEPGWVLAVDRGRYTVLLGGPDTPDADEHLVTAMKARELGRAGVVVGDRVALVGDVTGGTGTLARIVRVEERTNLLRRSADDVAEAVEGAAERPIVANADQLAVVTALADPEPRPRMVDRCLVAAYDAGLDPLLVLTKADLTDPAPFLAAYAPLDVPYVVTRRAADGTLVGLDEVRERLADRVTVLIGHSGVGKSTLVNALVGRKVAITSDKPQTTRRAIRGVSTGAQTQLVLVDLPGVQRPRDALTERMQRRVESELADSDAALLVINGEEGVGPGDRWIAGLLERSPVPVVVAVNKLDRLDRSHTLAVLTEAAELGVGDDVFPISARTGSGVGALHDHLAALVPESPFLYPPEEPSDQPQRVLLAELIREQVLRRTFQEVPHAVEVMVDDIERERELVRVRALAWVETDSQKGILIGTGGRMIKAIGTAARRELERELGTRVHLDLSVRVRRGWRGDEALLDRLGIE